MRKVCEKRRRRLVSLQVRKRKKSVRAANKKRHLLRLKRIQRGAHPEYYEALKVRHETLRTRHKLRRTVYRRRDYSGDQLTIKIDDELGIEDPKGIQYFLDKAASFIDFKARYLEFDMSLCNRIWPSGIVLLCSLKQWVELTSKHNRVPTIRSTPSSNGKVNSYLGHCGFYDYVGRIRDTEENYYSNSEIVKIERETMGSNIEGREQQIVSLLKSWSDLNNTQIEQFDSIILTEVFNNVTEHGMSNVDKGWWLLGQHHHTHKIISLCIADNGIGIRNSLMTGPQRFEIEKKKENLPENEGEFIKMAFEENVSGAVAAPIKLGTFLKKYPLGARRGNGLRRIREACAKLRIPFAILSHHGFLFISAEGEIIHYGGRSNRIFAGTLYHFAISSKE